MTDPAASIGLRACSADATAEGPEESRKKQNEGLIAWARDVCSATMHSPSLGSASGLQATIVGRSGGLHDAVMNEASEAHGWWRFVQPNSLGSVAHDSPYGSRPVDI